MILHYDGEYITLDVEETGCAPVPDIFDEGSPKAGIWIWEASVEMQSPGDWIYISVTWREPNATEWNAIKTGVNPFNWEVHKMFPEKVTMLQPEPPELIIESEEAARNASYTPSPCAIGGGVQARWHVPVRDVKTGETKMLSLNRSSYLSMLAVFDQLKATAATSHVPLVVGFDTETYRFKTTPESSSLKKAIEADRIVSITRVDPDEDFYVPLRKGPVHYIPPASYYNDVPKAPMTDPKTVISELPAPDPADFDYNGFRKKPS
jgi:hypothetical protein